MSDENPFAPSTALPQQPRPFAGVLDHLGMGAAVADEYLGGSLSALAGLNPFGSYGAVQDAKGRALTQFKQTYPRLAGDVLAPTQMPTTPQGLAAHLPEAMLLMASRAAKLGRAPGEWGSQEMLEKAKAAIAGGMSPDDAYRQYGWTNNAFDRELPDYMTSIDPRQLRPGPQFGSSEASKSKIGQQLDWPEYFAAHPDVAKGPISTTAGGDSPTSGGTTPRSGRSKLKDYRADDGQGPVGMRISGETKDRAMHIASHELQHAALIDAQVPEEFMGSSTAFSPMVYNSKATADAQAAIPIAAQRLEEAKAAFQADSNRETTLRLIAAEKELKAAQDYVETEARRAGYMQNIGEQIARYPEMLRILDLDHKTVPPQHRYIDIWDQSKGLGKEYDWTNYAPFAPVEP